MAQPNASFEDGVLKGYTNPACVGKISPSTLNTMNSTAPVGYCETFSFTYSMGAFVGINMGVVALMWLFAYPVMLLMLALPFRHFVECLVMPLVLLVVMLGNYYNPPQLNDVNSCVGVASSWWWWWR